jgi:hypothetical protein
MKIFATADIHGNRVIMDKLNDIVDEVDLIIICGDIGGKDIRGKTFMQFSEYQKEDANYLCNLLDNLRVDSRFVLGNDDWFEIEHQNYLKSPELIGDIQFIPFEFVSITPFNTNREVNENKLEYELNKLIADNNSIIVAHTPPLGAGDIIYNGTRVGSKSVRKWIEEVQPKMWLNGHIHEDNTVTQIGRTLVFNCSCYYTDNILRGWIIDTNTMDFKEIKI